MKISGIGIDIIENIRIKKSIRNKRFINRIFTKKEILNSKKIKNPFSYYAKRYAAKEAFVKSIGIGFRDGFNFKDISIINDNLGKPSFLITKKIKNLINKRFKTNSFNFFLSISDEKKYSIAFVIFQK
ncbi:MAG: holo-[acyl-carrier-protein] synthase [Candidatus Pelagibacter sp.]|nr:holo-[acyl-carrier-protein] synthase [Candidatus Pelagibacter sp.]|tara:strand:+ start:1148 stop:1531 length:384 start_codon:yes stop_codon:yes gene_type:complete